MSFHMVKCSTNGKFVTYEIYCNNKPFLKPQAGFKLSRRNAIGLVNFFNSISSEALVKRK
jgi:hypothetical protein